MSNFVGLSALLTITIAAIVTIQMLKDKFEMVENYGEENGNGNNSWTFQNTPVSAENVSDVYRNMPQHNQGLSDVKPHGDTPFGTGDSFRPPFVSQDANANGWNAFPEAYSVYQQSINAATPGQESLNAIGAETVSLPGPNVFMNDSFAQANINNGRTNRLNLCSQNMPTNGAMALNVASSLLPRPDGEFEGFESCGTATNSLANQVFLTPGAQIGTDTILGSLRNSNQSIRSEPPNPVFSVTPWNNTTIYPDLTRKTLEGAGPSFGLYGNGPNSYGTPTKIYS